MFLLHVMKSLILPLLLLVLLLSLPEVVVDALPPRACVEPHHKYPFCNASLPLNERLDDIISRLTIDEKTYLLVARESPKGNISRLGIPEYDWGANCMHGVQSRCSTVNGRCPTLFPNPNALGATFNKTLWRNIGHVIGIELRALWLEGVSENHRSNLPHLGLDCWSPNLGVVRDPRWGRNMETPSEDPFVLGVYGTQYTLGLQNYTAENNRYLMAVATLKHFVANSIEGPYWDINGTWATPSSTAAGDTDHCLDAMYNISRHSDNAKISLYDLHSTYLRGFQTAVVEGGAAGIMCSYNRVNGDPMCGNEYLLKQVLRKEWKFRGYITSDSGALDDFLIANANRHNYAKDWNETVTLTLKAGCDVESAGWGGKGPWSTGGSYINYVPNLVKDGLLSESILDRAVRNALEIRFRLGLFDPVEDQPLWHIDPAVVQSSENIKLAKEATAQGLVVLKNEQQILPLDPSQKIGLIGPHIYDRHTMLGNYLGEICKDDPHNGCITTLKEGFVEVVSHHGGSILDTVGCNVFGNDTSHFDTAIEVAQKSDVVVFIGGLNLTLEDEAHDRPDIRLPILQVELIQQLAAVNPNIVFVSMNGGMVGIDNIIASVSAFVSAGYPGPYAGEVVPEALFGLINANCWGKSPITWYHDDIMNELNVLDFDMSRPPGRTYRYYTGEPLFPFGYGMNPLTTFELTGLGDTQCVIAGPGDSCRKIILSVQVSNVGEVAGDEVIMAYFLPPKDLPSYEPASKLKRELIGFERIHVLPESKSSVVASFEVTTKTLEMYNEFGERKSFPGTYTLQLSNGIQTVEPQVIVLRDGTFELPSKQTDASLSSSLS